MKFALFNIVLLVLFFNAKGQLSISSGEIPKPYYQLHTDNDRMNFLMNAVGDSLNTGQLTSIYRMSSEGLMLAKKSRVDSMQGIFYFDLGKAFSYVYNIPDSAIFYFRKVFPFFPDKLSYYNLVAIREIMIQHQHAGRRDSSFAYLDSLHDRIDTLDIADPRRFGISSVMATSYQYYGMFKTAIALYRNSIEGIRKSGNPKGIGLPLANLAELYDESEDDLNAVKYARQALEILKGQNISFIGTAANLAIYYLNLNRLDSALYFNHLADSVGKLIRNDYQVFFRSPLTYTSILFTEKKYEEARKSLNPIRSWLEKNPDPGSMVSYLIQYADIDSGLHRLAPAADTLEKALVIARQTGQQVILVIVLQKLAAIYGKLKRFEKAYIYQKEYLEGRDSLTSSETKSRLADFEAMNKTKEKENQIALLQKNNDIKDLELKNNRQKDFLYLGGFILLMASSVIFFYQRNRRLKIQSQKTKAELQMKVFRSQMNPHFIFNSLNGIEYFILQNEKRNASIYLNKFASLIRIILSDSRKDVVPFADDMQTLRLYVDLELLRFNNRFSYITDIDQALQENDYRVPPLLIQPFVENAIIHGFGQSDRKDLKLKISALLRGEYIIYTIEDNGIGRKKSSSVNEVNKPNHTSLGLRITEQRISVFNDQFKGESSINIEDLYDENHNATGTKVAVTIKSV